MKKEIYDVLIVEGDCYPVPRAVTDWIQSYPEDLEGESSIIEEIPEFVRKIFDNGEYEIYCEDFDYEYRPGLVPGKIQITSGSWENDRVLHIIPFITYYDDMGYVRDWAKENDFKLGGQLEYLAY